MKNNKKENEETQGVSRETTIPTEKEVDGFIEKMIETEWIDGSATNIH